jgi:hypothetical protein
LVHRLEVDHFVAYEGIKHDNEIQEKLNLRAEAEREAANKG